MTFFILQSLFAISYLGIVRPFAIEVDNLVEGVSEIIIFLLGLRMITLFDDALDFDARVDYGNFSIGFLILLILVHWMRWLYGVYLVIKMRY